MDGSISARTKIEVRPNASLSERELAEYARMRARIDYGEVLGYEFTSTREWRVMVWVNRELASHAGISRRIITIDGRKMEIGAVGGVWTAQEFRGRGLATAAMKKATEFLCNKVGVQAGLLLCREHVASFYEHVGWQRIHEPLLFDQPSGKVVWHLPVLVWLCDLESWPPGIIDLLGLPW